MQIVTGNLLCHCYDLRDVRDTVCMKTLGSRFSNANSPSANPVSMKCSAQEP